MKTNAHPFTIRLLWVLTLISLSSATLQADTNTPAPPTTAVTRSQSAMSKGLQVYSIKFPGGTASEFFNLMRSNGFASDTILFAGRAGEVWVPEFTVRNVRLGEVAKSIGFVTEGKLVVEMVDQFAGGDVNIWRVKLADQTAIDQLKTRACAVPNLLAGPKANDRVLAIVDKVRETLARAAIEMSRGEDRGPQGRITIIESEKIVVAVGAEAYVEAIASALEAAEKVAASASAEKKPPQ
jgi:hypothetical protein